MSIPVPDAQSTTFDEKPSHQTSLSSIRSHHTIQDGVNREQEKDLHVMEDDRVGVVQQAESGTALEPVKSIRSDARDVASIPDGGVAAWLQVLGSFFLMFNSW